MKIGKWIGIGIMTVGMVGVGWSTWELSKEVVALQMQAEQVTSQAATNDARFTRIEGWAGAAGNMLMKHQYLLTNRVVVTNDIH